MTDYSRELFRPIHPPNTLETNLAPEDFKGVIDPKEAAKVSSCFNNANLSVSRVPSSRGGASVSCP